MMVKKNLAFLLVCAPFMAFAQVSSVDENRMRQAAQKIGSVYGALTAPSMPSLSSVKDLTVEEMRGAEKKKNAFGGKVRQYGLCLDRVIQKTNPASPVVGQAARTHDYAYTRFGKVNEAFVMTRIAWEDTHHKAYLEG